MAIKIGQASADENRRASGGAAGDQTGGEVHIRTWYKSPWDTVLRFKDPVKAEKAAKACEAGCANDAIGYDQGNRNDAETKAKAKEVGWDLSKIKTPTEVDCSSFMTLCAQCAGVDVPYVYGNAPYTGNMRAQFTKTGEFEVLTEAKYLNSDAYLKRGDILLNTKSHTAMALENGSKSGEQNTPAADGGTPLSQVGQKIAPTGGTVMLTPLPLLKKGSKGSAVWAMQTLLTDRGYNTQGVDSDFGSNTEAALERFQLAMGLEPDKECGPLTWEKLING